MRPYTHLGSYGIIAKDRKILLINKARGAYKGKLDLPGGSFEHKETPLECVTREIKEETGMTVSKAVLFDAQAWTTPWMDEDGIEDLHHVAIIYLVEVLDGDVKRDPDGLDSLGAEWYPVDDLIEDHLSPLARHAVNIVKEL